MLRFLFFGVVAIALVAVITRMPAVWRTLWAVLALIALYGVLKSTGVIDALAPARDGVF